MIGDVARLRRCSTVTIRRRLHMREFPAPPLPSIDRKLPWSARAVLDWIDSGGSVPHSSPARKPRRGSG